MTKLIYGWRSSGIVAAMTSLAVSATATAAQPSAQIKTNPSHATAPHTHRPNIIFILIDDLGWRDLGYTGSPLYETPAIDQLARDGMRFINARSSHPRCAPSRYSILTGRFPARGQVPGGARDEIVKPSDYTFAQALHDGGYATFMAGKWHLGKAAEAQPTAKGFDINIGGGSTGMTGSHFFPYDRNGHHLGPGLENGKPGEYLADRLTDETIKFMDRHEQTSPNQPFMVYLSHYGVHTPLEGKPKLVARFRQKVTAMGGIRPDGYLLKDGQTKKYQDNAVYAAMIASVDESVGRVRTELKKLGIADNTMIILTSDNGGLSNRGVNSHREDATSNLPLRAGKGHNYEGGIAVPMIVYWPGHTRAGSVTKEFTIGTDHYPSMLAAAGLPLKPNTGIDGVSYLPVLSGGKMPAHRVVYWYSPVPRNRETGDTASGAIRIGDWKYYLSYEPSVPSELFNLVRDPDEQTDLSASQPAKARELRGKLLSWLASVNAVKPRLVADEVAGKAGQKGKRDKRSDSSRSIAPKHDESDD